MLVDVNKVKIVAKRRENSEGYKLELIMVDDYEFKKIKHGERCGNFTKLAETKDGKNIKFRSEARRFSEKQLEVWTAQLKEAWVMLQAGKSVVPVRV